MITQTTNLKKYTKVLDNVYNNFIEPVLNDEQLENHFSNWTTPPPYFKKNTIDRCDLKTYESVKNKDNNFIAVDDKVVFTFANGGLGAITNEITDILSDDIGVDNLSFSNKPLHYRKYKGYNGFMGWHTNCDYPGDRWYLVYNTDDKSSFTRYIDNDGKMITEWEPKGWGLNHFVIGNCSNPFWHCIHTNSHRFSLGYRQIESLNKFEWKEVITI